MEELLQDHERLRKAMAGMLALLGTAEGVGSDERGTVDLMKLGESERQFSSLLRAHEQEEEELLSSSKGPGPDHDTSAWASIQRAHRGLEEAYGLLQAVTQLCDGRHIYALRCVMSRAADILERHLRDEERLLFPKPNERAAGTSR